MNDEFNPVSLDALCASLAYVMGVGAPEQAAPADARLNGYADRVFGGGKADRVFLYNPDAIAQWIYEKYPSLMREAIARTELRLPYRTVMPSVTPVCFGTMYTGAQPEVHGIRRYTKPVIRTDSLFDALLRAGKRPAIVAETDCSLSKIFLERGMDYYIYDTVGEVNAKAAELILEDRHDFILVYNGNYDALMHRYGPEGLEALCELRANSAAFEMFDALIRAHWTGHNTLVGFAMDHGCHEIDGGCGSHGLEMPEDLNIVHLYRGYPRG
ncbi:MAG: alkaline phosphatase family protein [Clostridia bacterium]|nr:alkaline phosphatase family protein [Clostridia bacterium]